MSIDPKTLPSEQLDSFSCMTAFILNKNIKTLLRPFFTDFNLNMQLLCKLNIVAHASDKTAAQVSLTLFNGFFNDNS